MVLTALVVWFGRRAMAADWPVRNTLFAAGTLAISVLHLLFASTGFFYRYEGYLIVLCLGSIGLGLHTLRAADRLASLPVLARAAMVLLVVLAGVDGVRIHTKAVGGMNEIHQQQLQMARFAASACPGCRVAVNDIGAVALYGEGTVMDVYGLANNSVLERRLDDEYDTAATGEIAEDEGVAFAMVYPPKEFSMIPGIPDGWERMGSWTIPDPRGRGRFGRRLLQRGSIQDRLAAAGMGRVPAGRGDQGPLSVRRTGCRSGGTALRSVR